MTAFCRYVTDAFVITAGRDRSFCRALKFGNDRMMDFCALKANTDLAWNRRASTSDFARRLMWLYSNRLPPAFTSRQWTIGFCYSAPIGDVRLCLRCNDGADAFIHSEVFEHQYYRLPLAHEPATILDLGANIGLSAIYFARLFPDAALACVEPAPDNLLLLRRNLALNGVRATVMAAAVDAKDRPLLLELQGRDYEHKIVESCEHAGRPALKVEGVSVPTILQHLSWDRIGLLKVDIEGHEAALFAGDCERLERVDVMCIEWHVDCGAARLASLAERFGFDASQRLPGIWFMSSHNTSATAA
jgi:FkbM family methyltransferase